MEGGSDGFVVAETGLDDIFVPDPESKAGRLKGFVVAALEGWPKDVGDGAEGCPKLVAGAVGLPNKPVGGAVVGG